jgi:DNA-binding SARP family transcriptional activator
MDFLLLGTLEARVDGEPLPLGGAKQRALLAILLLHANERVASDQLIDQLWGESPPPTATKALQVHVSQLRKLLDPAGAERTGTIATVPGGYVLHVEPADLDSARFEALLGNAAELAARGDAAGAVRLLDDALALWRGPPLADFAYERFADAEIARLEELRLVAMERRVDAALALGDADGLIAELQATVAAHPLRERPRAQLMTALYRAGRQAEALATYRDAHAALSEVGVEPSSALRELERAILQQDPALEVATAVAAEPEPEREPAPSQAFVGRQRELGELEAGLAEAIAGRGRLFLIAGEPGIGKSRLVEEVTSAARNRGALVLVGRCWEAGGAPAYWPWVQSLRPYVQRTAPEALRSQLGRGAPDLAQLLPEIRELFPELPAVPAPDSDGARFRLFDAVTEFLRCAAAAQPIVIALDDLHAADEPSLLLLQFVARELANVPVLVVCAYRDVDPALSPALTTALVELAREPVTRMQALQGLAEPAVARFVELTAGRAPRRELVSQLHAETGGNPLFVGEILRLLAAQGGLDESAASALRIPASVKEVIGRRLRHVSDGCGRLLALASVLGREFDLDVLAAMGELSRGALLDLLDEAVESRLVSEVPGSAGRMRFAHALIRDTAYQDLTGTRRAELHRLAGETIETLSAGDLDPHLAELSHHFFAVARAGGSEDDAGRAASYARRAAARAVGLLAYEEAVRLREMALELTPGPGPDRCELLLELGDVQARAGDMPAAQRIYREAAELAERLGLPEQLARAALGYGGRFVWEVWRGDRYLLPLLERALGAISPDDSPLRVRLLGRMGAGPLRDSTFDPERRQRATSEALAAARRLGDASTLAYALTAYIGAHHSPDFTPRQVELSGELMAVAAEVGDPELGIEAREHKAWALLELGDMEGVIASRDEMRELAEELRQPPQRFLVAVAGAQHALLEGRLDEAEELIAEAFALGGLSQITAVQAHRVQMFQLRLLQGRADEVEELVRRAAEEHSTYPICRCALARVEVELGQSGEAREALVSLTADDLAALPFDEEWLVSVCLLAEVAGALGDSDRAEVLYRRLLPYADRVAVSYPEISVGAVSRYLGLLAATLGLDEEAARHFDEALSLNERIGALPWAERTREDYSRLLNQRGITG